MEHAHIHLSGLATCLHSHQVQIMAFSHHGQERNYCCSWPTFEQNELSILCTILELRAVCLVGPGPWNFLHVW